MMKRYDPRGTEFLRMGRYNPDEDGCRLWWSGSGVRTRFEGVRLELEATAADGEHTPWLAVTVDGAPVARFPLRPGTHRYDLLGRLEGGATHEVALLRDTQPTDGDGAPLVFEAVYADGTLCAPESRPRLVEFLGDSLTVGEGTVGAKDCMEWRMIWISNQFAFPTLVAEAMNAEKLAFLSDIEGVYYDKDDPSTLISELTVAEAGGLIESGHVAGGMIPKLQNCITAIENGVNRVHILDGRIPHCLLLEIFTNKGIGTAILRNEEEKYSNENK